MSLTTPTTKQIADNIIAYLEATLSQTIPLLAKSFMRVLSKALAGVVITVYKYAGYMYQQMFVATASMKETEVNGTMLSPLKEHGRLVDVGDPVAATQAELIIDITVLTQTGTLPSGTQLINSSNGVTYLTLGATALSAATVQATIRAVSDQADNGGAGIIGNLNVADTVSFVNPLANVYRDTVVASVVTTGADAETEASYRQRVLDRFQKRPQGGALADYEMWAEEVAGIENAYVYTSEFAGQVDVYVEATDEVDGIPTLTQLQDVQDNIDLDVLGLATHRPANALANTFAITRVAFDSRVTGLVVNNSAQVQADITTAIEDYLLSREPYIIGLSVPPKNDRITRSAIIGLVDDIVSAAAGTFSTVLLDTGGVPTDAYQLGIGEKAKSSGVTFV